MRHSAISHDRILYKGQPDYPIGGCIHSFRIAARQARPHPESPRLRVRHDKRALPWMAHEVGSGTFDFTGETHPRRDLVGFLDLLGEMDGLALVLHNVNGYEHAEIAALLGLHPNTV